MGKYARKKNQKPIPEPIGQSRKPVTVTARNPRQKEYLQAIHEHDITFGIGSAGTGKTYLGAMTAVQQLTGGLVDKIVVCRPVVTAGGEDLGHLPGTINDKMDPFIQPIFDAFRTYWSPKTILQHLNDQVIEIVPLAYMRGRSFNRSYVLCDEIQNATPDNLLMLLTRLGEGSKIVVTGDPTQSDIKGRSCLRAAEKILGGLSDVAFVNFQNEDVVRHPTVEMILDAWPDNGMTIAEGGEFRKAS